MDSLTSSRSVARADRGPHPPIQVVYLMAVMVGVIGSIIGRRSRDLSTTTLSLMPVAIAINIAVGAITFALSCRRTWTRWHGAGWRPRGAVGKGALTGLLSNLTWSLLPTCGAADDRAPRSPASDRPHGRVLGESGVPPADR